MEAVSPEGARLLFNGALETGVRTTLILNALHPIRLDLASLTLLDHLVVHTGDLDGDAPASLHPNLPQRSGEMLVRRRLIENGIGLMRQLGMVLVHADESGIQYEASEDAYAFARLLSSEYCVNLKSRAEWLATKVADLGADEMRAMAVAKLGRWRVEFQGQDPSAQGAQQ